MIVPYYAVVLLLLAGAFVIGFAVGLLWRATGLSADRRWTRPAALSVDEVLSGPPTGRHYTYGVLDDVEGRDH